MAELQGQLFYIKSRVAYVTMSRILALLVEFTYILFTKKELRESNWLDWRSDLLYVFLKSRSSTSPWYAFPPCPLPLNSSIRKIVEFTVKKYWPKEPHPSFGLVKYAK